MSLRQFIFTFADAIQKRKKVMLTFIARDNTTLIRKCAPLDIAPSRKAKMKFNKFHFWDYDSTRPHILSLDPSQIVNIEVLDEGFNPGEIITWDTKQSPWCIVRDWGNLS